MRGCARLGVSKCMVLCGFRSVNVFIGVGV